MAGTHNNNSVKRLDEMRRKIVAAMFTSVNRSYATFAPARRSFLGVGVGPRKKNGHDQEGTLCLRFYVREKLSPNQVRPSELISRYIDGVETDVARIRPFVTLPSAPSHLPYSKSKGSRGIRYQFTGEEGPSGTIAAVVLTGDEQPRQWVLSANHILARNGRPFDREHFEVIDVGRREPILTATQELGKFVAFSPLMDDCKVDCAMVEVQSSRYGKALGELVEPERGATVKKNGYSTGLTRGTVRDTGAVIELDCGEGLGLIRFSDSVLVSDDAPEDQNPTFAKQGDSGSLVFQRNGAKWCPMGLVFGGPRTDVDKDGITEDFTAVCSLSQVRTELAKRVGGRVFRFFEYNGPPKG